MASPWPRGRKAKAPSRLSTHDGGESWTQIATMPSLGGVAVGGPLEGSQLVFTSNLDGMGRSRDLPGVQPVAAGSWWGHLSHVPTAASPGRRLPVFRGGLQYTLPAFFGTQDAVTLATKGTDYDKDPVIFVTNDGGTTWTGYPIPCIRRFPVPTRECGNSLRGRGSAAVEDRRRFEAVRDDECREDLAILQTDPRCRCRRCRGNHFRIAELRPGDRTESCLFQQGGRGSAELQLLSGPNDYLRRGA